MCVFSCGSCVVGSVMLLRVAGLGMGGAVGEIMGGYDLFRLLRESGKSVKQ